MKALSTEEAPNVRILFGQLNSSNGDTCQAFKEPAQGLVDPALATFVVTVVVNLVRNELVRRANKKKDEYTKTYAGRRNFISGAASENVTCIVVERSRTGESPAMQAAFAIEPLRGPVVDNPDSTPDTRAAPEAMVIRPVYAVVNDSLARVGGAIPRVDLTVSLALVGVVSGEDGPASESFFSQAFVFTGLTEGQAAPRLGSPSQYYPAIPAARPVTLIVSVTEKGTGGELYGDIAGALSANEDAIQALVDSRFGED